MALSALVQRFTLPLLSDAVVPGYQRLIIGVRYGPKMSYISSSNNVRGPHFEKPCIHYYVFSSAFIVQKSYLVPDSFSLSRRSFSMTASKRKKKKECAVGTQQFRSRTAEVESKKQSPPPLFCFYPESENYFNSYKTFFFLNRISIK